MELIWSNAGALGDVLTVLSEGAGLVLIGDCMNAVHADQPRVNAAVPSRAQPVHAATRWLRCGSGVTAVAGVSRLQRN